VADITRNDERAGARHEGVIPKNDEGIGTGDFYAAQHLRMPEHRSTLGVDLYSIISSIWMVGIVLVKFGTSAIKVAPCFAPARSNAS
jgi:hypothetical protein